MIWTDIFSSAETADTYTDTHVNCTLYTYSVNVYSVYSTLSVSVKEVTKIRCSVLWSIGRQTRECLLVKVGVWVEVEFDVPCHDGWMDTYRTYM